MGKEATVLNLKKLYASEYMVKKDRIIGEIPSSRRAYGDIMNMAIPSIAEYVLSSLISSVDTMMVSTLGTTAVAAVGLVGQPRMLILCFFFAINVGITAIVARRKGEERQEDANRTLRNSILLVLALCAVLMVISLPLAYPLMRLAGAEADTIDDAVIYFKILTYFTPFNALTMAINSAQRGSGNTRITLYCNLAANLVNVFFNYLLIGGNLGFPKMGVTGAALATGIGLVVGFLMAFGALIRGNIKNEFLQISFRISQWKPHIPTLNGVITIGSNAMIEQVANRIGFFTYAAIVARLGTNSFAAHQICMQFLNLSFNFATGVGVAGTSLIGQMLGRKRPDLSEMYGNCTQRIALLMSAGLALCMILFREPLVNLFIHDVDANAPEVRMISMQVMLVVALIQPFQMSSVIYAGCLRGAGDNKYVALVMTICVACMRPVLALAAVYVFHFGIIGAWMSSLIDMIVRLALTARRFNSDKWQKIRV